MGNIAKVDVSAEYLVTIGFDNGHSVIIDMLKGQLIKIVANTVIINT